MHSHQQLHNYKQIILFTLHVRKSATYSADCKSLMVFFIP